MATKDGEHGPHSRSRVLTDRAVLFVGVDVVVDEQRARNPLGSAELEAVCPKRGQASKRFNVRADL